MPTEPTSADGVPTAIDRAARDKAAEAEESESSSERDTAAPDGDRVAALERRIADLEAELEAVRALLDGVEAIDEEVERRAATALAKAEALEERFAPEEEGLVRERLPDVEDDVREERPGDGRSDRHRNGRHDAGTGPEREPRGPRSRIRSGSVREAEGLTGSADVPGNEMRASTTVGNGRTPPADTDTTDDGTEGTGAISSVGPGAPDVDTAAEETDQSLAARLRDAFQ